MGIFFFFFWSTLSWEGLLQVVLNFFFFYKSTQVFPMLCMGTGFQWLHRASSQHTPQLALLLCTVKSVELQFRFPFPLCSVIQPSDLDPIAIFSHISEYSLPRSGYILSQSSQRLWARIVKHLIVLPCQNFEATFLLITVKFNFTPFHSLFKDVLF